jgi:hypothetical protein
MRKCVLALAMGLLVMGGLGQARAQSGAQGGWSQRFSEGGCSNGPFNVMVVTMDSEYNHDAAFAAPAFELFADAAGNQMNNWTVTATDQKSATATLLGGSSVKYVQFNLNFAGAKTSFLRFTFDAYNFDASNGQDLVDHATATWDGNKWTIDPHDLAPAVPEASSLALLLPGLLPVAYFLRRRKA